MGTHVESFPIAARGRARESAYAIPWTVWLMAAACTSAIIGAHWDISWHSSIGRDDFWTPAHMAIYFCGVFGGISAGWLILSHTFELAGATNEATVNVFGLRAPLGAFLVGWGGLAMLTSAPFDDWWHNAYGLDTKILSPPHVLLIGGFFLVQAGSLILTMGVRNRAAESLKNRLNAMFLYLGGLMLITATILILEMTTRTLMHSAFFYRTVALAVPLIFAMLARSTGHPWAATIVASVYTVFMLGFQWILPLFPAEPKLGPVYFPVTYFVPPQFPLLLVAPALACDWIAQRLANSNAWLQSVSSGLAFVAVLFAVQYPFARFLVSDAAKNWFFGSHHYGYYMPPDSYLRRGLFRVLETSPTQFAWVMAQAVLAATLMTRAGLGLGNCIRAIQR
jgi:hypothetical protein